MISSDITDYPHHISVIDTHYHRSGLDASHLMIQDGKAAFFDVGTATGTKYLLKALESKGLDPADVEYIVLTHIHLDHAGGAGTMMKHCSNARLVVHPKGAYHMINPARLVDATIDIYGEDLFESLYKEVLPIAGDRVIKAEDGFVLDFHGRPLHFLDTPGHARHHCCIWDPASKGIFTGDTMGMAYPELQTEGSAAFIIPTTSPVGFEPDEMKKSIRRILDLAPETFYLTHFGPVEAAPESVDTLLQLIDAHTEAVLKKPRPTQPELSATLLGILSEAFSKHAKSEARKEEILSIVGGDIELNAQGLLVWLERQEKQRKG